MPLYTIPSSHSTIKVLYIIIKLLIFQNKYHFLMQMGLCDFNAIGAVVVKGRDQTNVRSIQVAIQGYYTRCISMVSLSIGYPIPFARARIIPLEMAIARMAEVT